MRLSGSGTHSVRGVRAAVMIASLFLLNILTELPAESAPAEFYPFAARWAKSRTDPEDKSKALENVFKTASNTQASGFTSAVEAPLPAIKRALSGISSQGESIELESGQLLFLTTDTSIAKFASTEEAIVDLETADAQTLVITAREVGKTVVHVWDSSGRRTFQVRVIPRKITGPSYLDLKRDEIQKTRPFQVRLTSDAGVFESGDKFQEMSRTSLDETHSASMRGDTPYGYLQSHVTTQRSGRITKNLLTDAQVSLQDGRIGPLKNFNAAAGDSQVKPDFLVFSRGRIRGAAGDTWSSDKRFKLAGFFGREQSGIFAPLSPSATARKRSLTSFLSGTMADYKVSDDLKWRAGYFTGYGRARPDELNRQGIALSSEANLGPHWTFVPELDFDTEHLAHLHALRFKSDRAEVRSEYRNINEDFVSMIGAPAQQGEVGGRWDATVRPWDYWRWRGMLDIFKDRRIPNPEMMDARNIHAESELSYDVGDRSTLTFTWRDWDDTGRISPTREKVFGLQYTESFDVFGRMVAVNLRGTHRRNRFLTTPLSDYNRNELAVGLFFPIFWDIRFSVQKEWIWLEDLNLPGLWSQPEVMTYGLNYSHRLWDSPFYVDVDFRYRDEEETESVNSFMTGEDSAEISGGIYYRETEDLELYLKGQFQNYNPESLLTNGHRVEAQVLAGMRWDWDTGIRWSGVGDVQGTVFKDENQNGLLDAGEPGISGVTLETAGGQKAVTDTTGHYRIAKIADRSATVTIESAKLPAGYVPTNAVLREVEIAPGKSVTLDFGYAPRSEIVGQVFNDLNLNGRLDPGEPGVGRVRIKLDGQSTSSAGGGAYAFRGVPPGSHRTELDLSSLAEGYLPSDATQKSIELEEGMRYEWNIPLRAYRVVSGRVFRDRDHNGAFNVPEDAVLSGVSVALGSYEQKTDPDGRFLFDRLPPGRYEVRVDPALLAEDEEWRLPKPFELRNEPQTISGLEVAIVSRVNRAPESYSPTGPVAGSSREPSA